MTKKRGPGRPKGSGKKKSAQKAKHAVPVGFWRQVGAVFLVVFVLVVYLGLLGLGGVFPVGLAGALLWLIGWAAWVLPLLLVWQAVAIFQTEDNRVPLVTWFAVALFAWFTAGLFQLLLTNPNQLLASVEPLGGQGGGLLGWALDAKIFAGMFDAPVLGLILFVLCLVLLLYVLAREPSVLFGWLKRLFGKSDDKEIAAEKTNKEIAQKAAVADEPAVAGKIVRSDTSKKPLVEPKIDAALTSKSDPDWKFPGLNLLERNAASADPGDYEKNGQTIINTLAMFDIPVVGDVSANVGPRITQYTFLVKSGTKLRKIVSLDDELKSALRAEKIRIEAPIPGRQEVGIEVPNVRTADVRLYGMFNEPKWQKNDGELMFAVGRDTSNNPVFADLAEMPHLLIAGQTKSGKSVMVNALLTSLLYSKKPSELKLIMVDPKTVELVRYKDIPHLLTPIISDSSTDPSTTIKALTWAVVEMDRRYKSLSEEMVTNIKEYNDKVEAVKASDDDDEQPRKMPYVVIVVDEMADLMMSAGKEVEKLIIRLAQKGRAAGVHLVLATQSPRKEIVTGLIKANIPAKIAFAVNNYTESVIIMGSNGAEKLLGKGDMLLLTSDSPAPKRIQGALVDNGEVNKVCSFVRIENRPVEYDPEILATNVQSSGRGGVVLGGGDDALDPLFNEVAQFAIENGELSGSNIVTNFQVGYGRSARILSQLEKRGVVGAKNGTKPREVLVSTLDELE
ncbi:MAG: DNA translocase FtsK [Candidatus Nomurabacteria bacterium]|jgi:S-DNA-T family DNA segregation ATPase FtsK/SpoIIIE|nr:DNA translocase FtsK [Candidatus Nomurabacteria bacterium]